MGRYGCVTAEGPPETRGSRTRLMHVTPRPNDHPTAVVIKAILPADRELDDPLDEISELSRTAGVEVVDRFIQRLERPRASTYLGKGKIEEVAERVKELEADLVITDNDLSPGQERNLEQICGCTVIDRSQLIMDIFSQRAATHQAKLQVELAQLRYTYPRLKRLWTHLSRYEGGIGMRGPGETQLETDKRLVAQRIQRLERELEEIERHSATTRKQRESEFVIALVGYTNAGKSTLLNRLTGSAEFVEDKLFATLDTRVRRWEIAKNRQVLVTDTVGFIRALPHHLVASFHATLAETKEADLILHVVDAGASDAASKIRTVEEVLAELECAEKETWLILNKWETVPEEKLIDAQNLPFDAGPPRRGRGRRRDEPSAGPKEPHPSVRVSALTGYGIEELRERVLERIGRLRREHELLVPQARGDVIAFLQANADVSETEYRDDVVRVRFEIAPAREAKLRRLYPEAFPRIDVDPIEAALRPEPSP
jgi:GTP-binding protein HflX